MMITHARRRDGWQVNHKLPAGDAAGIGALPAQAALRPDRQPGPRAAHRPKPRGRLRTDRLPTAFAYLDRVLDAWSRRRVGWQLSRWIETDLTPAALERALAARRRPPG